MKKTVATKIVKGGRTVCECHDYPVRWVIRRTGEREYVHCEHPKNYIVYGDGYIPDYCEACGWRA